MPNLLLYHEAREQLEQLHAAPICPSRGEHPLAYPEELFDELKREQETESAYDQLVAELFDSRRTPRPEYAY